MVSQGDKRKVLRPRKRGRLSSVAAEEKEVRAPAAKKAVLTEKKRTTTKKTVSRTEKKGVKARSSAETPKKRATVTKPAVRKRTKAVKRPMPPEVAAGRILVVQPHSTIEGARPHAAAPGPSPLIAVPATKYEVTPPDRIIEPVYPQERVTDLPGEYGDTRLVLMARDPEWIFFYWEIGKAARQMLGLPPQGFVNSLVVRLHDITGVEEFNGTNSLSWYEIPISGEAVSWYVHLPEVDREWIGEMGILNAQGEFIQICRSNVVRTPRDAISGIDDPEWMSVAHELREILARSADVAISSRIGSEAAIRQISRRLRVALARGVGASAAPAASMGAARLRRAVAAVAAFPLTVRTELIVSGTTDPQARVTIQGQPVVVRPDGSFTMRFELPDGEQVIPVRAVSSDGTMSHEIIPVVRRATRIPSGD